MTIAPNGFEPAFRPGMTAAVMKRFRLRATGRERNSREAGSARSTGGE